MKQEYETIYHDVEQTHFWFKARRNYIINLLKDYPKEINILDIGCSSGILLRELAASGFDQNNLYGIDISEKAISNCKRNGLQNTFVMDAQKITLEKQFDVIIASDCLEHLQDDLKALENWHSLLKEDGVLFVFVPAFMALWSAHDEANMHFRRYVKSELINKLIASGFNIENAGYWNFFLFFPAALMRYLEKLKRSSAESNTGNLEKPSAFNNVLYTILGFENKLLRHINFPFGVSTFCIAGKS